MHTKGPWKLDGKNKITVFNGEQLLIVGAALDMSRDQREAVDNARLIAAAPELLEELEDIVARNEIQHWFNLDRAKALIAKARGVK